jgi:HSP20 family protein
MSQIERRGGPPTLRRVDPFRELDDFRERMVRMLEQTFSGGSFGEPFRAGWAPLVDVEETNDAYVFEADLPGLERDDVTVEVDDNELRISGDVREREREGVLRRKARMTGRFDYRSTLPRQVDPDRIEASLRDGVLTVRVPKSERSQPRRVEISGGSEARGAGEKQRGKPAGERGEAG